MTDGAVVLPFRRRNPVAVNEVRISVSTEPADPADARMFLALQAALHPSPRTGQTT
jgi:hypothetical protein